MPNLPYRLTAQFANAHPPGTNGNGAATSEFGSGHDTMDTTNSSMSGTNPYVKARGSIAPGAVPPVAEGTPQSIGSVPPDTRNSLPPDRTRAASAPPAPRQTVDPQGPNVHSTDKIGEIDRNRKTKSVLIAAAIFLLLLAAATSITLSLKNKGATSSNAAPVEAGE